MFSQYNSEKKFVPNPPFVYPLKTSENRKFSDLYPLKASETISFLMFSGGVKKGCIEEKWVNF